MLFELLQGSAKKCYCDSDNCNKDDDCKSCDNPPGISCQTCNGQDDECDSIEDMGESKRCQSGEVCGFGITGILKVTIFHNIN